MRPTAPSVVQLPRAHGWSTVTYGGFIPFVIDDSRFRGYFGVKPTPADTAARDTVIWARDSTT
jgi:hypothetical protein